jgi:hypothetical protein
VGYIADLSRYDPLTAVDAYDGVILNIEDPGFAAKRDRAVAKGIPWGTYSWVYPGRGANAAQAAHDAGVGPLGAWLDYEQVGVGPDDLTAALARGDELGLKLGVYTYLYILPSVAGRFDGHPLWLAYYPGQNDGSYRANFSDDARARGAVLHQFTSSNGTRDLSVVVDEPAWSAWTGSTTGDDLDMTQDELDKFLFGDAGYGISRMEAAVKDAAEKFVEPTLGAWEKDTRAYVDTKLAAMEKRLLAAIAAK